jgi:competence protein ComEC
LRDTVRCDATGCVAELPDGRLVAYALSPAAFAEDCARAAIVISRRRVPGACKARLIDGTVWRAHGALALRWTGQDFALSAGRPPGYQRPWTRAGRVAERSARTPATARDATPRGADLEAGDQ